VFSKDLAYKNWSDSWLDKSKWRIFNISKRHCRQWRRRNVNLCRKRKLL